MGEVSEVKSLLDTALALGLAGAEHCACLSLDTLAAMYNGVGPARAPGWLRWLLDKCHRTFLAAVMIHDVDFSESDGTTGGFDLANDRLEYNCLLCADAAYGAWNPLRYVARRRARKIAGVCRAVGWTAWMDAFKERTGKR